MMFPTGMSPAEGWESQLVVNLQEKYFCAPPLDLPLEYPFNTLILIVPAVKRPLVLKEFPIAVIFAAIP